MADPGAPRKFPGVETVPLVGGLPCLDFVNTTGARASRTPRERLRTYDDLLTWCSRTKILGGDQRRALARLSRRHAGRASTALARALDLREASYRLFLAAMKGEPPDADDARRLQRCAADEASFRRLAWTRGHWEWTWRHGDHLASPLAPIALSAIDLLTQVPKARVRKCGECDWLFVDGTKNRSRVWCKATCRDRVKARRYYRRRNPRRSS